MSQRAGMVIRRRWIGWLGAVAALGGLLAWGMWPQASSEEANRDGQAASIWGAYTFGHTHAVMQGVRGQMQAILVGFLDGNIDTISRNADEIAEGMQQVAETFPAAPEDRDEVWTATRAIIEQARLMQTAVHQDRYQEAYRHFTDMTSRCVACHQINRVWGKFSRPLDKIKADEAAHR